MHDRIIDCLSGKDPNYLYPFLVLRRLSEEQTKEDVAKELDAVKESGCGGVYIETRYDDTWGDEEWFDLIGFVLEESRKRDIKIWLLDDAYPPSGKARWVIPKKYPHLRRKALVQNTLDVIGPQKDTGIPLDVFLQEGESLYAAIAYRVDGTTEAPVYSQPVELTDKVQDGLLIWDVPEGFWRVFLIFNTQTRGVKDCWDYVDVLNPESCQLMISEVYDAHYSRFREYFGNTLAAFFTDEPMIGNMSADRYRYDEKLGEDDVVLPWRADLVRVIAQAEGWTEAETRLALPAFWRDIGGKTPSVRRRYMDILSRCYSENFVRPMGQWCTEHGILYTGHILEDMDSHFRFGWGTCHFFRSQEWQHTAGIDLVLQQLRVGGRDIAHSCCTSARYSDPRFFLYALTRLGLSGGHLYPRMEGRIMCENGGAGGWGEGLSSRKYSLDAMFTGGCNLLVPAIFSPRRSDEGIAPFVYDHGQNPQFAFQKQLMQYANRMCHVLTGGVHKANALVYYPAEADWAGDCKPTYKTVAPLMQAHIDLAFAPWDLLEGDALTLEQGKLKINKSTFDALIVPSCAFLPSEILNRFDAIAEQVPVIFEDSLPMVSETRQVFAPKNAICMPNQEIPGWFKEKNFVDFKLEGNEDLMHLHMDEGKTQTYFFFNLSSAKPIDAVAEFLYTGPYTVYDAWENTCCSRETADGKIRLRIPAKGTLVMVFGADMPESGTGILPGELDDLAWRPIDGNTQFRLSMQNSQDGQWQQPVTILASQLHNLAREYPRFSGTMRYEAKITTESKMEYIDLGAVGELAGVTVNGVSCGQMVTSPFRFRVADAWKEGENTVEILVASNCGYRKRNEHSKTMALPPTGLLGPVRLA